ncbi:hypothetical protein P4K12_24655, partial [Bacillus cereus]|nr:hypothetical protein [Bacillus cereus]MEB9762796.1 hypothetical protein [Bacillus cereus]
SLWGELLEGKPHEQFLWGEAGNGSQLIPRQSFTRQIIFKTWKSLFQIHHWQTIKQERLECHVYGKLIAIFICSSTMFKMRQLLLQKHKRELSEYKAIGMIQDHLSLLYQAIQRNTRIITKVLIRLFTLLKKNGRKSHRYEKKTIFDIMGVVYEYNGLRKQKKAA